MSVIKSSLINLKGHKLRVFITLIWIIIGITSSILVSSIGNGLKKEVTDSVNRVNPNKTRIYFESDDSNMVSMESFLNPFKLEDVEQLSFIDGVERISSSKDDFTMDYYYSDAYFNKKSTYIDIKEFKNDKIVPVYGRSFSYDDDNRKVIIITLQNATDLFTKPKDAIGQGITISNNIYEARFLDLFSGSGGIGIEALSRGASEAVMVENNPKAALCINENLEKTKLKDSGRVFVCDVLAAIDKLNIENKPFDYIFMDPPYNKDLEREVLQKIKGTSLVDEYTTIIVEASLETGFDYLEDMGYKLIKCKKYKTNVHMFIEISA